MAAAARVHDQQVDGVAAHVKDTYSHAFNLTAEAVNFVSASRCGEEPTFQSATRKLNTDSSNVL
jgi:hypothetical protein